MEHTHAGPIPRRRAAVSLALALVAATLAMVVASTSPAQAASSTLTMAAFQGMAVDPASGRVFVAGDDRVEAFAPDGTSLGTVADVPGAGGMAFSGGYLWVAQTTAASIAKIDPTALAKVAEYATDGPVVRSIAAIDGKIWFMNGDWSSTTALKTLDTSTGAVATRGPGGGVQLISIPGSTTRLLISGGTGSPYSVSLYDISANPVIRLAGVPFGLGSNLRGLVATEAGTFVTAAGAPYRFDEISTTPEAGELQPTGVVYPGTSYPIGIAYSPSAGGVFAGTVASSKKLFVSLRGIPRSTHEIALPGDALQWGVALSPDATRAYTVTKVSSTQVSFNTHDLAPTFTSSSRTSVPQGQTTRALITGTGLGAITGVKLGGAAVDFAHDGPTKLELEVRPTVPTGATTLTLTGPLGGLSIPFTVVANGSAMLKGKITNGLAPVSSALVVLTDESGAVTSTTSAGDGSWSLPSVANGRRYDLGIVTGAASHVWRDLDLQGAGPFTFDVDLLAPPSSSPQVRRYELPPGEVRRVINDPTSGKTFVSVGDEIVVFDAEGRLVKRIVDQWTADDLQVVGTKLYAMLHRAGRYSVIDIPSLTVTKTVPVRQLNTGTLAVAGNRLFYIHGDDQWTNIDSIDLTTNAIAVAGLNLYTPLLAPVDGEPLHFLSWDMNVSATVTHWNAATPTVTKVASTDRNVVASAVDIVASGPADKAWAANGTELTLSTMDATGVNYPAQGSSSVARSRGHGGVLVFGQSVSLQGQPVATHTLPSLPAHRSSALDAAGNRSYVATAAGELVVTDLAPIVSAVTPARALETPADLAVTGAGLGGATAVEIDGEPVPFSVVDPSQVEVDAPALLDGEHELVVTTPWGTSSPRSFSVGAAYAPFTSWEDLVRRLYVDLTNAQPTTTALDTWVYLLSSEDMVPGDLVEALRRGTDNSANVDPVARLYRAFLGRTPDASGLRFWVGRKRAGTWTVTRMADSFAASSEFKTKYGQLSNRAFVTRIYADVMGRPADPDGVRYWTGKLDRKERTRGQVMIGFSESSEYRRKQAENTDVAVTSIFLLGRAPTAAEVTAWVTRQEAGTPPAVLADELLDSVAYANHVA